MKSVLHIIDTTGPGGAETVFIQLAKATADSGFKTIALVRGPGWVLSELNHLHLPSVVLDCKGSINFKYLSQLVKLIKTEEIDVIQTHLFGSAIYGCLAGLLCRKPVFCTFHGMVDIAETERMKWVKLLALRLGSRKIITVTDRLNAMLKSLRFIARGQVETIYNGININEFKKVDAASLRTELGIGDDFLIGSVGNIRTPKNYPLAIQTIYALHQKGIKAHYAIAGQGNEKQMQPMLTLIKQYDLQDYVHILGFVGDVQQFLSSLNIFFMTSSSEGHPLALTQAMVNGLPIVTTPSGVEEIIDDGIDALITHDHNADNLADAVMQLYYNTDQALILQQNAAEKASRLFSLNRMTTQYIELYESGK